MVARRLPLDGPRAPRPRTRAQAWARRTPDGGRAGPPGAPQAPAARREARGVAAGHQGRRAADAPAIGRRTIALRNAPRPVAGRTPERRNGNGEARRGTSRRTLFKRPQLDSELVNPVP